MMKSNSLTWREEEKKEVTAPITVGLPLCLADKICSNNTGNGINGSLKEMIRVFGWRQKESGLERA